MLFGKSWCPLSFGKYTCHRTMEARTRIQPAEVGRLANMMETAGKGENHGIPGTEQIEHGINSVLLVRIEGPVWYVIYHHLPVVEGVTKPLY